MAIGVQCPNPCPDEKGIETCYCCLVSRDGAYARPNPCPDEKGIEKRNRHQAAGVAVSSSLFLPTWPTGAKPSVDSPATRVFSGGKLLRTPSKAFCSALNRESFSLLAARCRRFWVGWFGRWSPTVTCPVPAGCPYWSLVSEPFPYYFPFPPEVISSASKVKTLPS